MPNWCYNHLEISGPKESLQKFYNLLLENAEKRIKKLDEPVFLKEEYISFLETFIPASDYFRSLEGFNNGGYEWCIMNWGTKWPERLLSSYLQDGEWEFIFETAWSPPLKGYTQVSEIFSDLMFVHYYQDEGLLFAGAAVYQNGITIFDYETDDFETYLGNLGDEFDGDRFEEAMEKMKEDFLVEAKKSFSL